MERCRVSEIDAIMKEGWGRWMGRDTVGLRGLDLNFGVHEDNRTWETLERVRMVVGEGRERDVVGFDVMGLTEGDFRRKGKSWNGEEGVWFDFEAFVVSTVRRHGVVVVDNDHDKQKEWINELFESWRVAKDLLIRGLARCRNQLDGAAGFRPPLNLPVAVTKGRRLDDVVRFLVPTDYACVEDWTFEGGDRSEVLKNSRGRRAERIGGEVRG